MKNLAVYLPNRNFERNRESGNINTWTDFKA